MDITEDLILADKEINKYDRDINIDKITLSLQPVKLECIITEDNNNEMYDQDNSVNEMNRPLSQVQMEYDSEVIPKQEIDYIAFHQMMNQPIEQESMDITEVRLLTDKEINKYDRDINIDQMTLSLQPVKLECIITEDDNNEMYDEDNSVNEMNRPLSQVQMEQRSEVIPKQENDYSTFHQTIEESLIPVNVECMEEEGEPTRNNNFKIKQKQFFCSECDFKIKSERCFTMHRQSHSRNQDIQNERKTNLMDDFKIHDATHSEDLKFGNTISEAKSSQAVYKNQRNHLRKYKFSCTTCNYKTNSNCYFDVHLNTHSREFKFHCLQCDFKTNRIAHYTNHQCTLSEEYKYHCKMCIYKTNRNDYFKFHQRAHTLKYRFSCEECGYKARISRDFKVHKERHAGEYTNFTSTKSGVKTISASRFEHHQTTECAYNKNRSHSEGNNFCSTECDYKSVTKYQKSHMWTRASDFKFICTKCDYKTNNKSLFDIHEMNHFGKYKFNCTQCQYKGNDIQYFKIHSNIHRENKFHCSQCKYKASRKDSLKSHLSRHSGIYKFNCSLCPFKSNRKIDFAKHQTTHSE